MPIEMTGHISFGEDLRKIRIGYVPISNSMDSPGDRRRFPYYANKRGLNFEIANPKKDYDLIILTQRADISVWSRYPKGKVVYDLIDSYLAIPRGDLKGRLRGLFKFLSGQSRYLQIDYWEAISQMCKRSDAVLCSTEEQKRDILNFCNNVYVVLDAHFNVVRKTKVDYSVEGGRPFRLVWEGLPQTANSLAFLRPLLMILRERYSIEVHVVTDRTYFRYLGGYGKADATASLKNILSDIPFYFHEWSEATCANIICSCDLAVIPLILNDSFAAGKPENKLLLFWRMAMPVITSSTPAYTRAMGAAGMSYAAKDEAEWLTLLECLISDENARCSAGLMGKSYVERVHSEARLLAQWDAVFESLGFNFNGNEFTS